MSTLYYQCPKCGVYYDLETEHHFGNLCKGSDPAPWEVLNDMWVEWDETQGNTED